MAALFSGLVVFALLALLVLTLVDSDRDVEDISGFATVAVWFAYLVHADTVVTAAYLTAGRLSFLPATPLLIAGLAVCVTGFAMFLWASITISRNGAFDGPVSTRLVTTGPYALSRHPQDLGWATMLVGVAIAGRSIPALVLVAIFAWFASRLWRADEKGLHRRFGSAYSSWRATTPLLTSASAR